MAPKTVLLSEGASLSARQIATALSLAGYRLELCDPDPHCLTRLSGLIDTFHRSPSFAAEPERYLDFVLDLCRTRAIDVVLPCHDQTLLFAAFADRFPAHVGLALPAYSSIASVVSKTGFREALSRLGLSQPASEVVHSREAFERIANPPRYAKTAIGTASTGVWRIESEADKTFAADEITSLDGWRNGVVVQQLTAGRLERVQGVFDRGKLVAAHGYWQVVAGHGGGDAIKEGLLRPELRAALEKLGTVLHWHGAMSLDYLWSDEVGANIIDCNPRLVEPMNGVYSGINLADALVRVSLREAVPDAAPVYGRRSHMLI